MWKDPMSTQNPYTMNQHLGESQTDDYFPDTPEVRVQFRKKPAAGATHNNVINRHSYHGGTSYPDMFHLDHRFSHVQLGTDNGSNHRCSLFISRTQDDKEQQSRCNRQRYSGNFGLSLAVLHENGMSSTDPMLNNKPSVDTMQQGSDMQDSPRDGSIISGVSSKREDIPRPQHSMVPPGGIPLQGQVLVDPSTGQHYLVPQTAFYQPLQPMYYPPPQPAPMYYPYNQTMPPQQGTYVMPPGPQIPQNNYSMSSQHMQHNSFNNHQRPVSSSSSYRHGFNHSLSSADDLSRRDEERRFDDHPPQSPTLSAVSGKQMFSGSPYQPQITSFAQQFRQNHSYAPSTVSMGPNTPNARTSPSSQPDDPDCGRDNFRRDVTRSSAEFTPRSSGEFVRQGSGSFHPQNNYSNDMQQLKQRSGMLSERTPLYGGPPQWWGRNHEDMDSLTDVESKRPITRSPPAQSTASDSEAMRPASNMVPSPRVPPAKPVRMDFDFKSSNEEPKREKPPTRSVRLDFDLSKPLPEEEELLEKKKAVPRAPGTAFTVSFDSPGEVSLQDAARKSAQARRALSRRTGTAAASNAASRPETSDGSSASQSTPPTNKTYLLNKLLNGANSKNDNHEAGPEIIERQDCDAVSEAGTFVIDSSNRPGGAARMMPTRLIDDSDDDSTDSDSGSSRTASPPRAAPPPKPVTKESNFEMLKELCKLRQTAVVKPSTVPVPAVPRNRIPEMAKPTVPSQPLLAKRTSLGSTPSSATSSSSNRSVYGHSNSSRVTPSSASSTVTSNAFRRGDGGRFSMRGAAVGGMSPQSAPKRPPFRAGAAPLRPTCASISQQREQEMNAWLRRKDYNPMKAAAEAKKQREQQARGDQFVSNRSISFHVGPNPVRSRMPDYGELTRNRSQESLAVEDAEHASQQIVAEYSRGVVKDLNRLSQQSSKASGKQLSGLARAVDMLSQKCKKSIELIRSQNKGCLSVSVEDLLAAAAEPPRQDESLNEQLDRLSNAFDAVQRYLEQYSLDGHESPIPEFNEDQETNSIISGFSGFNLKTHQNLAERDGDSGEAYRSEYLGNQK